jgi:hypothetical protein
MSDKQYLGDSVYVEIDDDMIVITTENDLPDDPSNVIYLEPEVFDALVFYVARATSSLKESSKPNLYLRRMTWEEMDNWIGLNTPWDPDDVWHDHITELQETGSVTIKMGGNTFIMTLTVERINK